MSGLRGCAILALLFLVACGSAPKKPNAESVPQGPVSQPVALPATDHAQFENLPAACAPAREHDDRLYTPGGLYDPGRSDSALPAGARLPLIADAIPRAEPRSKYGNRSPYTVLGKSYYVMSDEQKATYRDEGVASWYGYKFHGRTTSNREIFDMCAMTAAHKTLPLPSYVRVTNMRNGKSVVVRVNDRGPFHAGRVIDLSYAAAHKLDMLAAGTASVSVDTYPIAAPPSTSQPVSPGPVAETRVYIQLGSYSEKDNAERMLQRLRDLGFKGWSADKKEVGSKRVWRVRLGPIDRAEALKLVPLLSKYSGFDPHLFSE